MPKKRSNLIEILKLSKYLNEDQQLKLINQLSQWIIQRKKSSVKPKKWTEMSGLGKEIWEGN